MQTITTYNGIKSKLIDATPILKDVWEKGRYSYVTHLPIDKMFAEALNTEVKQ